MKVLYVASKATDDSELNLTKEITELQRRFATASAEPVEFHLLPDVKVEDLPGELSRFKPDILHIASHGDQETLSLSDQGGNGVKVTAEMLHAFLPPERLPRLVYLNACDSEQIATALVAAGSVAMAIGSTAPISNRAARAAAVAFYERLLAGLPVQWAYETCKRMLEALTHSRASAMIHWAENVNPETEIMHPVPMLVADFDDGNARPEPDNHYSFRLGILGCPASTGQVVFFTDDETFIKSEDTLENDLCLVVRTTPVDGVVWAPKGVYWRASGDHRLFAVGVKSGGGCYTVAVTLCAAIENRYRLSSRGKIPKAVREAIGELRRQNGAELDPVAWDAKSRSRGRTQGQGRNSVS